APPFTAPLHPATPRSRNHPHARIPASTRRGTPSGANGRECGERGTAGGRSMADTGKLSLTTREVMKGMPLTVRLPRSFTLRTRIACWLLGLAGRVMDVPCDVEMARRKEKPCGPVCRFCGADAQA